MEEIKNYTDQDKKTRPSIISVLTIVLLGIILVLLTCNLSATGYLLFKSQQNDSEQSVSTSEPLPDELDSANGRDELFEKFREPFNNKDDDSLYELLNPLVRVEVTREKFDEQMPLIYQIGNTINSGVYSHYDYQGISRGRKVFILHYIIETDKGTATLDITVAKADQEPYTVWGFHLNTQ